MADLANIGTLVAFAVVSIGVIVLRRLQPELERKFRVPFSPVVPVLAALGALFLIYGLPHETVLGYFIWLVVGLAIYFGYSRRRSVLSVRERAGSTR